MERRAVRRARVQVVRLVELATPLGHDVMCRTASGVQLASSAWSDNERGGNRRDSNGQVRTE